MRPRFSDFFTYARARHQIYLKRAAGYPRPWTEDPILDQYRFTNVFRELDKTTAWYRNNVRLPFDHRPEVLLATVVFRMFNRIEVGEAIFCQESLTTMPPSTAFERFLASGDASHLRDDIVAFVGMRGPYATGAYIISSPPGYSKLDGILKMIEDFNVHEAGGLNWRDLAGACTVGPVPLETVFDWLATVPYFGHFHSYEIVTDLRHTYLLRDAPDVMRWCNIGPGAARGLNRIYGRAMKDNGKRLEMVSTEQMLSEMRDILAMSGESKFWPKDWPRWEMRDVEHTLCEFDKMERVRLGQGRPRGVYR